MTLLLCLWNPRMPLTASACVFSDDSPVLREKGAAMSQSRRLFLKSAAAATAGAVPLTLSASPALRQMITPEQLLSRLDSLPGDKSLKIFAPAVDGKPEFLMESNASQRLFVASAFKAYVLCQALRQADSPDVVQILTQRQLPLDASVWSLDSATFNPPNLIGMVSERTTLEAMINHSDNTATDMSLKHVGVEHVRNFITSAGLRQKP
jgi:beta-lactamase class A